MKGDKRILIWIVLCFMNSVSNLYSQTINDTILDGSKLYDLKKANPKRFYYYDFDGVRATLLKFKKGKVVDFYFKKKSTDLTTTDTTFHTNGGFNVVQLNLFGNTVYNSFTIFADFGLYLSIKGFSPTGDLSLSLDKFIEIIVYEPKNGQIDFKMYQKNDTIVREQWDKRGNLQQIDSTNSNHPEAYPCFSVRFWPEGTNSM